MSDAMQVVSMTKAEYEALDAPDSNILYLVTDAIGVTAYKGDARLSADSLTPSAVESVTDDASAFADNAAASATSCLAAQTVATTAASSAALDAAQANGDRRLAEDAKDAANASAESASGASASAVSARNGAESARAGAESARDYAYAAKAEVVSAKDEAVEAAASAVTASASAVSAGNAAVSAKNDAVSASAAAVSAGNAAVSARNDAVQAKADAQTASASASSDASSAASASAAAVSARDDAVSAKTAAVSSASDAANSANLARSSVDAALNAARSAANDASVVAGYVDVAAASEANATEAKNMTQAIYESVLATVATYYVGPAYNYGVTVSGTILSFTWTDPSDNDVVKWAKTRLVMKRGGFPADETDGEILIDETVRNTYKTTPFTWDAGATSNYYFALFTQTTGGVWRTDESCPRFTTDTLTWATIAMMTRAGTLMQYQGMAIGSVIPIKVNDLYPAMRYKLAHVDYAGTFLDIRDFMYDNTRLHNSIWIPQYLPCLGADNSNASMMQFDAPETSYGATWDTAFITGKAYYTVSDETYTQLTEGTDYQDGDSVADWQTLHGDTVYSKNHSSRVSYGNNIWKESNMRQWLNASGNDWFQKQNEYDVKSGNTDYRSGWLTGFVSGFLDLVMPVYNKTARNTTATISGGGGGGYDMTLDQFWLPSLKEFNGSNVHNIAEGSQFAYFRDVATTNAQRIQYDEGGTARNCFLRSPNAGNVYSEYNIIASGSASATNAHFAYAFLPAMCIA